MLRTTSRVAAHFSVSPGTFERGASAAMKSFAGHAARIASNTRAVVFGRLKIIKRIGGVAIGNIISNWSYRKAEQGRIRGII